MRRKKEVKYMLSINLNQLTWAALNVNINHISQYNLFSRA